MGKAFTTVDVSVFARETDLSSPKQIKDRYVLDPSEPRPGGMSIVRKAYDHVTGQFVALKFLSRIGDDKKANTLFFREFGALDKLKHKNIVRLIEADVSENGEKFLVLEWIESDLEKYISRHSATSFAEFFDQFGNPILDAIVYAQSLNFAHRDIKPKNILITENEVPKIADYGISKYVDDLLPSVGTVAGMGSPPYTPKEDDDGLHTFTRDVYSFAALTIDCLSGGLFESDEHNLTKEQKFDRLQDSFLALNLDVSLKNIFERCLSDNPKDRPATASALQAELENYNEQLKRLSPKLDRICYLQLTDASINSLTRQLGQLPTKALEEHILEEINEVFSFSQYQFPNSEKSEGELTLWGVTWAFRLKPSPIKKSYFDVTRAWMMSPSNIERLREDGCILPLKFSFSKPPADSENQKLIKNIFLEVLAHESQKDDEALVAEKEQFFRRLYTFLSAKNEIERRSQEKIVYENRSIVGESVTLETDEYLPSDLVGEERIIKLTSGFIIRCEIDDVRSTSVDVTPVNARPEDVPVSGELLINTRQIAQAIERQRVALDSVFYNRSVNPNLKQILLEPNSVSPPQEVNEVTPAQKEIDPGKLDALYAALGNQNLLAIEGPPGTGKTTLITEIIIQYLKAHPTHRILLSSQTHIALDNVIESIFSVSKDLDIVRIGKPGDQKIAKQVQHLLLDSKVESWSKKVAEKAATFLSEWALQTGVDQDQIAIGIRVEKLLAVLLFIENTQEKIESLEAAHRTLDEEQGAYIEREGGVTSDALEMATEEKQEEIEVLKESLKSLRENEKLLRDALKNISDEGKELSTLAHNELREWLDVYLPDDQKTSHFRKLVELSEQWILRVGKTQDFFPVVLGSSQVIAGTCIGMASVPGIQDVSFDLCIVDEASKATPTEILVPMARSKKWVLVGDPKQLPPFIEQEFLADKDIVDEFGLSIDDLRITVLERVLDRLPNESKKKLRKQYRMVEGIGDLVSSCFYNGDLQSPKKTSELDLKPSFAYPVTWLTTSSLKNPFESTSGSSFQNKCEAEIVSKVLDRIEFVAKAKKRKTSIAVIAGYTGQVAAIKRVIEKQIRSSKWLHISCNTVDAFQGRQADICIYSVTRSNRHRRIGFLREFPRLNVALSRAKSHLIIIGDHLFCRSAKGQNPFIDVITHIESNSEFCEIQEEQ